MKTNELADKLWEGCDGCTETDKEMWVNGFISGYNYSAGAKPISEDRIMNVFGENCHHSLAGTRMLNEKEFKSAIKELNR